MRYVENPPPGSYFRYEGITAARDQVLALRPNSNVVAPESAKGKYNWETIAIEFGRCVYSGEIDPERSSGHEATRLLQAWCAKRFKAEPVDSTMRDHVDIWLKEFKKR